MPDLSDIIQKLRQQNPDANVAGYIEGNRFYYEVSNSANLPAAAFFFDGSTTRLKTNIYTTLPMRHWLYTYMGAKDANGGLVHVSGILKTSIQVNDAVPAGKRAIKVVAGEGPAGPLGSAGGLFDAAKTLTAYKKSGKVHTNEKGLHRALRYYMLAAYAVLGKCARAGYEGGNYVCALAVNDSGQIFSWGVNSGSFHHGEVNMLLNYFASNAGATHLPSKAIVFSTLTPCQQCSTFLQAVRPKDSFVFMGQKDTGDFGKAGEEFGTYLRDLTDPVTSRYDVGEEMTRRDGNATIPSPTKRRPNATAVVPQYIVKKATEVTRSNIDIVLGELVTDKNIASKVGQFCKAELCQSYDTLGRKFSKTRSENLEEQKVKIAVLTYLQQWMKTVDSELKTKNIA